MPQKQISHYQIVARVHRPIPPLNRSAMAGSVNIYDIYLYNKSGKKLNKLAELSFYTGSADSWPDDYYTEPKGDKYLVVSCSTDAFSGVVDILRNETNRYFQWEDPKGGRALATISTAAEPTGEGDSTP